MKKFSKSMIILNVIIVLLFGLFLLFPCRNNGAFAQAPIIKWQKCLGGTGLDRANSIQQTSDGGFIVAGTTESYDGDVSGNHGGEDILVVKLTSLGGIQWQKCLGGTNSDYAISIWQTSDGGFILTGYIYSNDGDVSGNHGNNAIWLVKLTSLGCIQWQKCLDGTNYDNVESIQQTSDGGFIVAGTTNSNDVDVSGNHGDEDILVVKLTNLGDIQWQKCLGGTYYDFAESIQQTSEGGFIVAGTTNSNDVDVSGNHGDFDYWIVKLTSLGGIQWQKCLGGTYDDSAESIQQTSDGGFIVAGCTEFYDGDVSANHGGDEALIVKLNSLGDIQWQKCLGGAINESATYIQQTSDGGFIMTGCTYSNDGDVSGNHGDNDIWVVKLTSLGGIQWQKCLGGTYYDFAESIQKTSDGGYIVTGLTESNDGDVSGNHGGEDIWIVKLK